MYDTVPSKIGYNGKYDFIYVAYSLENKPDPHQAGRISNALMQLTEHHGDRTQEYVDEEEQELVIAIYQKEEYPLILQIT